MLFKTKFIKALKLYPSLEFAKTLRANFGCAYGLFDNQVYPPEVFEFKPTHYVTYEEMGGEELYNPYTPA